jgi:hypothetical protein
MKPFRPGDYSPTLEQVAELLVAELPERDRKTAINLLINRILPVKLAGLAGHPHPERRTASVQRELLRTLSTQSPNMRLHALQVAALQADILAISRDGLNVAIARYLLAHPEVAGDPQVIPWLKPEVEELRRVSADVLARRAEADLRSLRAWQERVRTEYPAEWERERERYVQVHAWLAAAETGRHHRQAARVPARRHHARAALTLLSARCPPRTLAR